MPFIGYAQLAELVGKTEEEVRQDRSEHQLDLDNFESLVKYVATAWGWAPSGAVPRQVSKVTDNVEPPLDPYLERIKNLRGG
jgi:hypothetical protein